MHLYGLPKRASMKLSTPLSGKTYNNNKYLSDCSYQEDAVSKVSNSTIQTEASHNSHRHLKKRIDKTQNITIVNGFQRTSKKDHTSRTGDRYFDITLANFEKDKNYESARIKSRLSRATLYTKPGTAFQSRGKTANNTQVRKCQTPRVDLFKFPEIKLFLLDKLEKIQNFKELQQKAVYFSFEKYFKQLFKKELIGDLTEEFINLVEQYMSKVVKSDILYKNVTEQVISDLICGIYNKKDLVDLIFQLQIEDQNDALLEVIKHFCRPPSEDILNKYLVELIGVLVDQVYEKRNCSKDFQYVLLQEDGTLVQNLCQVKFSTKILFLSPKINYQKSYSRFHTIQELQNHEKKATLQEEIKFQFRNSIAKDKVDQNVYQYKLYNFPQQPAQNQLLHPKKSFIFNRTQSKFSNYSRKLLNHERRRFRDMINPKRDYNIRSNLKEKIKVDFQKLFRLNQRYNIVFNYQQENQDKLLIPNICDNCSFMKNKNRSQKDRILETIKKVYFPMQAQFEYITFEVYQDLYMAANGIGEKDKIMKIIGSYLGFNDFGQISRRMFKEMLRVTTNFEKWKLKVVESVLWELLEKNNLVLLGMFKKRLLELWYEPVKVIYFFFSSLIFGDNCQKVFEQYIN